MSHQMTYPIKVNVTKALCDQSNLFCVGLPQPKEVKQDKLMQANVSV